MSAGNPALIVRVDPDLKEAVEQAASEAGLKTADWHRKVLQDAVKPEKEAHDHG